MMKKYINYLAIGLIAAFTASCDYNDRNFDGLDESSKPTNNETAIHTLNSKDYSAIAAYIKAKGGDQNAALANQVIADQSFSAQVSVSDYMNVALMKRFFTKDPGTAGQITFDYKGYAQDMLETDELLSEIEDKAFAEDFDKMAAGTGVAVGKPWIMKDLKGSYKWENRERTVNGVMNRYAQVSSFKSTEENEIWMISGLADLSLFQAPIFEFDIVTGNYNATCLEVYIADDFTGKEADIEKATWKPITDAFTLPTPATGYSDWASAGKYDLKDYVGKKVHVAFKYLGDDKNTPKKTTTYQIDNVKVYESKVKFRRTSQFVFTDAHEWAINPTITLKMQTAEYNIVVNHVKADPVLAGIPGIVSTAYNSENYYGFNASKDNITYREGDRSFDPVYKALATAEEKLALKDQRSIEGIQIVLRSKYPHAKPVQDGIEVFAYVTVRIFEDGFINTDYTYTFQCVDTAEKWQYIERKELPK